jgi:hypothetical protein
MVVRQATTAAAAAAAAACIARALRRVFTLQSVDLRGCDGDDE